MVDNVLLAGSAKAPKALEPHISPQTRALLPAWLSATLSALVRRRNAGTRSSPFSSINRLRGLRTRWLRVWCLAMINVRIVCAGVCFVEETSRGTSQFARPPSHPGRRMVLAPGHHSLPVGRARGPRLDLGPGWGSAMPPCDAPLPCRIHTQWHSLVTGSTRSSGGAVAPTKKRNRSGP
jgi:hypothetical protein